MRMGTKTKLAAVALGSALIGSAATIAATGPARDPVAAARDEIWAKELAIYADRGNGQLDFYVANASPRYLGWPPTAAAPMPLDGVRRDSNAMRGKTREQIKSSFKGFTLSGSTAVIYYANHRTMKADGTPVDQLFENIHVWTQENGKWRLIGGLARQMKG